MSASSDAARRFRRRVASHTQARRHYLAPDLREEAEMLSQMVNEMYATRVNRHVRLRVKRIRAGASVRLSRFPDWKKRAEDAE